LWEARSTPTLFTNIQGDTHLGKTGAILGQYFVKTRARPGYKNKTGPGARLGKDLGKTWARLGQDLGKTWARLGQDLGKTWARLGQVLGKTWARLG
jgi:hypothetical protein